MVIMKQSDKLTDKFLICCNDGNIATCCNAEMDSIEYGEINAPLATVAPSTIDERTKTILIVGGLCFVIILVAIFVGIASVYKNRSR